MSTALRVPGLVRQPVLVAQTVVRRRALAQWYPLRLESRLGRQTALLEPAVVPASPLEPVARWVRTVVGLARSRLPPAWLLALPAPPPLQAAWHCPVLQERSVAARRARESQRACSQPGSAWKHLPAPVYCCRGQEWAAAAAGPGRSAGCPEWPGSGLLGFGLPGFLLAWCSPQPEWQRHHHLDLPRTFPASPGRDSQRRCWLRHSMRSASVRPVA